MTRDASFRLGFIAVSFLLVVALLSTPRVCMSDETPPDLRSLWNFQDPAGSETRFRALLETEGAQSPPERRGAIIAQIARTQGLRQQFDDARETLATLDSLIESTTAAGDEHAGKLIQLHRDLERGRVENSSNHQPEAIPFFTSAWEIANELGEENLAIDAAHMLGIAEEPAAALVWNKRALAAAEAATDPAARRWMGPLLNNIGWTLAEAGEHAEALSYFERDIEYRGSIKALPQQRIARWSRAKMLRLLSRADEALAEQDILLEERKAAGEPYPYASEELGECLLALGRGDEAKPHFAAAYEGLKDDIWLKRDEPDRLARLAELGGVEPEATDGE